MTSQNSIAVDMDVDGPSSGPGTLKRCSSAPMINEGAQQMSTATTPTTSTSRESQTFNPFSNAQPRTRRFSTSFSPVPGSPVSGLRLTPRINQLRQEEHADISNSREMAHEREIQHTIQISQSWEDLSLMSDNQGEPKSRMLPLHVNLPSYSFNCNSPSPTRLSSPGFQSPTRGSRTIIRRSCSPVLKPSPLGVKRKLDDDKLDFHISPRAKRLHSYLATDRGLLTTSATSNSLPGSLSSVGTPESLSSADSPNFCFRNHDSPPANRHMNVENIDAKNDQEMIEESPS